MLDEACALLVNAGKYQHLFRVSERLRHHNVANTARNIQIDSLNDGEMPQMLGSHGEFTYQLQKYWDVREVHSNVMSQLAGGVRRVPDVHARSAGARRKYISELTFQRRRVSIRPQFVRFAHSSHAKDQASLDEIDRNTAKRPIPSSSPFFGQQLVLGTYLPARVCDSTANERERRVKRMPSHRWLGRVPFPALESQTGIHVLRVVARHRSPPSGFPDLPYEQTSPVDGRSDRTGTVCDGSARGSGRIKAGPLVAIT
ncbi:hypothetical protein F5Y15DRAFT_118130 [Xylariaceae sp. FL0016]|nr:hypothetical protein F5Y15DRAFT_118130 [Xylariaceae sp. FL0016]